MGSSRNFEWGGFHHATANAVVSRVLFVRLSYLRYMRVANAASPRIGAPERDAVVDGFRPAHWGDLDRGAAALACLRERWVLPLGRAAAEFTRVKGWQSLGYARLDDCA